MTPVQHIFAMLGSLSLAFFGIGGVKVGNALADASVGGAVPDWSRYLLGPLGALVGMVVAVWWLAKRLNRVEEQARKDQEARQSAILELMTKNAALSERCAIAIESNTEALERLERLGK